MSGSFTAEGINKMKSRGKEDPTGLGLFPNWAFAWPVNRRIIYNRASCDVNGKPYNPKRNILEWKGISGSETCPMVPGRQWLIRKREIPLHHEDRWRGIFIRTGHGRRSFSRNIMNRWKGRCKNPLSGQLINPAIQIFKGEMDKVANASEKFPYVCTTYSCTEHWCSGALTRWQAWLLECNRNSMWKSANNWPRKKALKTANVSR